MLGSAHCARRFAPLVASLVLAGLPLIGCQQISWDSEDDNDDDWMPSTDPWWEEAGEGAALEGGEVEGNGDGDGDDTGPAKLDVPDPDASLDECKLVDLLFVIDNSNSMSAEQASVIASFDGFISGIQANLDEANDYHVGVVTTDDYALNTAGCRELGALVTASAAGVCGPWAAGNYISLADELAPAFTCAADVGGDGSTDEHQIDAALRAVGPALAGEGECNAGFIREDALLVLVIISDEDDGGNANPGSDGGPNEWFAELAALKGVESNVVVLGLVGQPPPNACDPSQPFEGAQVAWRIRQFVSKFSYGRLGDVCEDNYAAFFDDALELIADACTNFTPEG